MGTTLQDLLLVHGGVANIPEIALSSLGYEKKQIQGVWRVSKKWSVGEEPIPVVERIGADRFEQQAREVVLSVVYHKLESFYDDTLEALTIESLTTSGLYAIATRLNIGNFLEDKLANIYGRAQSQDDDDDEDMDEYERPKLILTDDDLIAAGMDITRVLDRRDLESMLYAGIPDLLDQKEQKLREYIGQNDIGIFSRKLWQELQKNTWFNEADTVVELKRKLLDKLSHDKDLSIIFPDLNPLVNFIVENSNTEDWYQNVQENHLENNQFTPHLRNINRLLEKAPWYAKLVKENPRITPDLPEEYFVLMLSSENERNKILTESNIGIDAALKSMGVDLNVVVSGIPSRTFDLGNFEVNESNLAQMAYRDILFATSHVLGIVHNPAVLAAKAAKVTGIQVQDKDHPLEDLVKQIEGNADLMIQYAGITLEYIQRRTNIRNVEIAQTNSQVAQHHFRKAISVLRGKGSAEMEGKYLFKVQFGKQWKPTDISLGYESGCCLREDMIFPHLEDRATQFVEIYKGETRVGMLMGFSCQDQLGTPIFAINSIELSGSMSKYSKADLSKLVDKVLAYTLEYANKAGYQQVLLGNAGHNTAFNYSSMVKDKLPASYGIQKIGLNVYGDIIDLNGVIHSCVVLD